MHACSFYEFSDRLQYFLVTISVHSVVGPIKDDQLRVLDQITNETRLVWYLINTGHIC